MDNAHVEIESVRPERTESFRRDHEREALSTQWNFPVIWHEQSHELAATIDGLVVGALRLRIAASLEHIESLVVALDHRKKGIGRLLLDEAEALGKYYNCHKVTLEVPADRGAARAFFEACDYKVEAVLPQHTWKRDVAILRKFLL